jgi:MoxR-like ATPase
VKARPAAADGSGMPLAPPVPSVAHELGAALVANVERVVRGRGDAVRLAVATVLAGGHLLVEDAPGHGKTLLAKALARSVGGVFRRAQGTPDLLPTDLTGVSVFRPASGTWEFRPGPLFGNVVVVDELNRATPRTQSALLEAMEERQVTVDGTTYRLPEVFVVVATQNPMEHAGTFPLVEGQRDRLSVVLELGHPGAAAERALLLGEGGVAQLDELAPVADLAAVLAAQQAVRAVHLAPAVADHVVALGEATRRHPGVALGQSPRASLALVQVAKAWAAMHGRAYVTPDDVRHLAPAVLAHRLVLAGGGVDHRAAAELVRRLLAGLPVPPG